MDCFTYLKTGYYLQGITWVVQTAQDAGSSPTQAWESKNKRRFPEFNKWSAEPKSRHYFEGLGLGFRVWDLFSSTIPGARRFRFNGLCLTYRLYVMKSCAKKSSINGPKGTSSLHFI